MTMRLHKNTPTYLMRNQKGLGLLEAKKLGWEILLDGKHVMYVDTKAQARTCILALAAKGPQGEAGETPTIVVEETAPEQVTAQ